MPEDDGFLDFLLYDSDTQEPLRELIIRIESSFYPVVLYPDENGWIRLPVNEVYLKENPNIFHSHTGRVSFKARFLITSPSIQPSGTPNVEIVSLADELAMRNGNLIVYFPVGHEDGAKRLLNELNKQRVAIKDWFGLDAINWAALYHPDKEPETTYLFSANDSLDRLYVFSENDFLNHFLCRFNLHEWVEATLEEKFGMYQADGRNRFIGDGLAELAVYRYCGFPASYLDPLHTLHFEGRRKIDLLKSFRALGTAFKKDLADELYAPGYPISFWVWYRLCLAYGEELPREFLNVLAASNKRTSDQNIRILEELAGTKGLNRKLRNINLCSAIKELEAIILATNKPGNKVQCALAALGSDLEF